MKIFIIIALVGIISSDIPIIYYNYDYDLISEYATRAEEYYFKAIVQSGKKMEIELIVLNNNYYANYFTVTVLEFQNNPYDSYIKGRSNYNRISYPTGRPDYKGDYTYIDFAYEASSYQINNIYLGIIITRKSDYYQMSYLTFRVDVTKYYYSNIKDLNYNTDYEFDVSIWNPPRIPYEYQVFVRISVHPEDKMEIRLETKVYYNKDTDFRVDVCQFKEKPNEYQVYYGDSNVCKNGLGNDSSESKKYVYPFTTEKDINYLSIRIINQLDDLDYLYVYIYSETGMAIAVLVVIIVIPCLVVIAVVGFLLKKFGCIGRS